MSRPITFGMSYLGAGPDASFIRDAFKASMAKVSGALDGPDRSADTVAQQDENYRRWLDGLADVPSTRIPARHSVQPGGQARPWTPQLPHQSEVNP